MNPAAQNEYLTTQVLTATPQKLHLMLIEAAIRNCDRAKQLWDVQLEEAAGEALTKAQDIITELTAGLNFEQHSELARRLAGVYNFVFRSLVTAHVRRDEQALADAVRILEIERETWRQLCYTSPSHSVPAPKGIMSASPHSNWNSHMPTSSMSFEA